MNDVVLARALQVATEQLGYQDFSEILPKVWKRLICREMNKMTEINKDILDINEAMNRFADTNESVGYANGSINELINERIHARNEDDWNAFNSKIECMNYVVSECKDARDKAREDIKKAFEHYYS